MTALAGRCACGLLLELAARDRSAHRDCVLPETGDGKVCTGPCGRWRRIAMFYLDRRNNRRQSWCRYCKGTASNDHLTKKYRTNAEFRERERARKRRPDAVRRSEPGSPSSRAVHKRQEAAA